MPYWACRSGPGEGGLGQGTPPPSLHRTELGDPTRQTATVSQTDVCLALTFDAMACPTVQPPLATPESSPPRDESALAAEAASCSTWE